MYFNGSICNFLYDIRVMSGPYEALGGIYCAYDQRIVLARFLASSRRELLIDISLLSRVSCSEYTDAKDISSSNSTDSSYSERCDCSKLSHKSIGSPLLSAKKRSWTPRSSPLISCTLAIKFGWIQGSFAHSDCSRNEPNRTFILSYGRNIALTRPANASRPIDWNQWEGQPSVGEAIYMPPPHLKKRCAL